MKTNTTPFSFSHLKHAYIRHSYPHTILKYVSGGTPMLLVSVSRSYNIPDRIEDYRVNEIWSVAAAHLEEFCDMDLDISVKNDYWTLIHVFKFGEYSDMYMDLYDLGIINDEMTDPKKVLETLKHMHARFETAVVEDIPRRITGNITPGAFFVGTKFTVAGLVSRDHRGGWRHANEDGSPKEYEAKYVVRNGPDSWVVVTNTPSDITNWEAFNLSHVNMIVSQPKRRFRGTERKRPSAQNFYGNGRRWTSTSLQLMDYIDRLLKPEQVINREAMVAAMNNAGVFVRSERHSYIGDDGEKVYYWSEATPKRAKRWVKQNINRFLVNPRKAQKAQDKMDREIHERLDRMEYEREYGSMSVEEMVDPKKGFKPYDHDDSAILEEPPYDPYDHGETDLGFDHIPRKGDDDAASDERFALPA